MTPLFFVTSNSYKFEEFARLFAVHGITLEHVNIPIQEIQTIDLEVIARDKLVKAYARLSRPVLVDASGLGMVALGGLPQGLNNQFWDVLKDEVCGLAIKLGNDAAEIAVCLGICDGQHIYTVYGKDQGKIAPKPSSVGTFHLDRVFIPNGSATTLAEMTQTERDKISHRAKAVSEAVALLKTMDFGRKLGVR
jgi:XTP/dITP diphosphohydrolase